MPSEPTKRPLRILLADADASSRLQCRRILERLGHRVTEATEGVEAIGLLREGPWDVVLTDQHMPGASGTDVLERAVRLQPTALRLLMTDRVDLRTRVEAVTRAHADALIEKPALRDAFAVVVGREPAEFEVRLAEG